MSRLAASVPEAGIHFQSRSQVQTGDQLFNEDFNVQQKATFTVAKKMPTMESAPLIPCL